MPNLNADDLIGRTGNFRFRSGNVIGRCTGIEKRLRSAKSGEMARRFVFVGVYQPIIPT